jgi:prenyltransferase beta subunit
MWTVCSGIFDNNGNMWVLENSVSNEVRARKITKEYLAGNKNAGSFTTNPHLLTTLFTIAGIILLFFGAKMILNKKRQKLLHLAI